jgi:hypothetical protein
LRPGARLAIGRARIFSRPAKNSELPSGRPVRSADRMPAKSCSSAAPRAIRAAKSRTRDSTSATLTSSSSARARWARARPGPILGVRNKPRPDGIETDIANRGNEVFPRWVTLCGQPGPTMRARRAMASPYASPARGRQNHCLRLLPLPSRAKLRQ